MWILYSNIVAVIINIILAIFLFAFVKNGVELIGLLYVSDEDATSNSFDYPHANYGQPASGRVSPNTPISNKNKGHVRQKSEELKISP